MNPEEGHKEIVREIKDLHQSVQTMMDMQKIANEKFDGHAKADLEFQKRLEPLVQVFENNKITSMEIKNKVKSVVFYTGSFTTIGAFLYGLWYVITHFKP